MRFVFRPVEAHGLLTSPPRCPASPVKCLHQFSSSIPGLGRRLLFNIRQVVGRIGAANGHGFKMGYYRNSRSLKLIAKAKILRSRPRTKVFIDLFRQLPRLRQLWRLRRSSLIGTAGRSGFRGAEIWTARWSQRPPCFLSDTLSGPATKLPGDVCHAGRCVSDLPNSTNSPSASTLPEPP